MTTTLTITQVDAVRLACRDHIDRLLLRGLERGLSLREWTRLTPKNLKSDRLVIAGRAIPCHLIHDDFRRLLAAQFAIEPKMPIRERAAMYRLAAIGERAKLKQKLTPKVIQFTTAERAIKEGINPLSVLAILGKRPKKIAGVNMTYPSDDSIVAEFNRT